MSLSFEQEKNIKAGVYTFLICIALSLLFIVMHWQQAAPTVLPPEASYMEVNLGNSNTGQGDIAPNSKEAPAPEVGSSKKVKATAIKQIPVGFLGEAADFASLALWLLSPHSRFITGQTISVDGGAVKGIMG